MIGGNLASVKVHGLSPLRLEGIKGYPIVFQSSCLLDFGATNFNGGQPVAIFFCGWMGISLLHATSSFMLILDSRILGILVSRF